MRHDVIVAGGGLVGATPFLTGEVPWLAPEVRR